MQARGLTSDVHVAELRSGLGAVQALELNNVLQVFQHPRDAMPFRRIRSVVDSIEMCHSSDCCSKRTIVDNAVVISVGELKRTKDMGNDILQRRKVLGVEDRVRHCRGILKMDRIAVV